jgi:hypothetical protein
VRNARSIEPPIRGETRHASSDATIAALADAQYGVVSRAQLQDHGVDRHAIAHRLQRRRLRTVHRGVYAVGHRVLTAEGRWMAATIAGGPCAVLSHRAAASLWLLKPSSQLEVTVPTQRHRPGIRIHRSVLGVDETTWERGIPTTTVPRTLLDLATVLPSSQLERAINEAEVQRLTDPLSLPDLLDRYPRRPGTPAIRAILTRLESGMQIAHSELEDRFLTFVAEWRLPPPEVNVWLQIRGVWLECDCIWRSERLVVELDGRATHGTAAAFERDRARDRALNAAGWRTVRITWHQLQSDAPVLAEDLRAVLGRPSV